MRVLRLDLEYDGAGFSGWAAQPGRRTVEGELRRALGVLLGEPVELAVAGRTDAGVHASGQVVSVATGVVDAARAGAARPGRPAARRPVGAGGRRGPARLRRPPRRRRAALRVPGAHRGALAPLRRGRVLHHPGPLDADRAARRRRAAAGQHDFRAFTPTRTEHVFFDRTVAECDWSARGDELVLAVEADAFLRHMVRILAGTMLLVGRGAWPARGGARLLEGAPRGAAGPTAPGAPPDAGGGPLPARPGVTRGGAAGAVATLGGR